MTPDFSLLNSELNLPPDCSLEEFKRAYRRRIAQLHPDRTGVDASSADAQAALSELIATYVAVNRFHRRYGRMPGASHRPAPRSEKVASRSSLPVAVPSGNKSGGTARPTLWLVVLFMALLVLLASWDWLTFSSQ